MSGGHKPAGTGFFPFERLMRCTSADSPGLESLCSAARSVTAQSGIRLNNASFFPDQTGCLEVIIVLESEVASWTQTSLFSFAGGKAEG